MPNHKHTTLTPVSFKRHLKRFENNINSNPKARPGIQVSTITSTQISLLMLEPTVLIIRDYLLDFTHFLPSTFYAGIKGFEQWFFLKEQLGTQ